ncbi:MAG: hypothetical protein FWB88_12505 [Defluviitaleaceae bacterium]|nr:hypothetical protein [Defluviitaleaceae bacterium]MCL2240377.1 hypothetical protein [Defluviitaleaceae bacterium]
MERIIQLILETSLLMSGAVVVLLLFGKLFANKTRPALRHICWLLVAVGLLMPFRPALLTFTLPQTEGLQHAETVPHTEGFFDFEWAHSQHNINPAPAIGMPYIAQRPADPVYAIYAPSPQPIEPTHIIKAPESIESIPIVYYWEPAPADDTAHATTLIMMRENIWLLLFSIWAVGAVGFVLFHAIHHVHFIRKTKRNNNEITSGALYNLFIRMRCYAGVGCKVRLMANSELTVPIMYGYFRPVIVLPAYLLHVDNVAQRLIILHEMLHIKRGDILTRLLYFLAVAVHWFNPLVHLMNRVALDESEKACDDAVLRHSDDETRTQYGKTLLNTAWQDVRVRDALAYALTGNGKNMKSRLKNIITKTSPKRWVLVLCTVFMVTGAIVFSLINFRERNEVPDENVYEPELQFYGETLHLFAPIFNLANQHMQAAAETLRASHQVEFALTTYLISEFDHYHPHRLALFAAGMGPDIFVVDSHLYPFIERGFLMDINEIIPERSRFYENALAGFEFDGRLYAMPMGFRFSMVGINADLPAEIVARFAALETASALQLLEIYVELVTAHPQFADYYFMNMYWLGSAIQPEISYALDIVAGTVAFPESTAALLDGLRAHMYGNANLAHVHEGSPLDVMESLQSNTVFHVPPMGSHAVSDAFFPFEREFFTHYIPITDERGALVNHSLSPVIAVSAKACPDVAWAFIEALLEEMAISIHSGRNGNIHISRQHARPYLARGIAADIGASLRPITTSESDAITTATDRILALAELPIAQLAHTVIMPLEILAPVYMDFMRGSGDATAAVVAMEDAIMQWLGQEIYIEAYVPAPVAEPATHVQTLTVHADERHSAMFQQAAAAMNASWQARGKGYAFELVMDDWRWNDFAGAEARGMRLQTELMAGQGPDIFIAPWMNLRAMARNGILADIYTLIDACAHMNRGDFFENVLAAYEFDGGLYLFPTAFTLHQVGINTGLPQHEIASHTARGTITLREMLEIYDRTRTNPETAHWEIGMEVAFDRWSAVSAAMVPFIDWDTRTANLTDPRFVTHLELIQRVFDDRTSLSRPLIVNAPGVRFFADYMHHYIFEMMSFRTSAANAFFPRTQNLFVEYRPLADEMGRLLLDTTMTAAWATLSITAAGQPALAWEFITYLLREYPHATGRAATIPGFGMRAYWAGLSIATPILRANADMPRRMFGYAANPEQYGRFMDWNFSAPREEYIDAAMARLAELNEMPMVLVTPMIDHGVFLGPDAVNLTNFMAGAITAETFAQMIHNSITLWLWE